MPARNGHVVRDYIEHLPETALTQPPAEPGMRILAAQLFVHPMMIYYVVAMSAAGSGLQIRRTVDMAYAKIMKIFCYGRRILECEIAMQLDAVRGEWNSWHSSKQISQPLKQ
jgi:hypothetical protein